MGLLRGDNPSRTPTYLFKMEFVNATSPSCNQYLQIFALPPQPPASFPLFPRLPADVRYLIWEKALSHERLLRIAVQVVAKEKKSTTNSANTCRRLHRPGKGYHIILKERQAISKLFCVTSESRRAALSFYRVHLPCRYDRGGQMEENGTLYLCPELDIVEIETNENSKQSARGFASFAQDVWTHDPRRIGLVNLSIPATYFINANVGGKIRLAEQGQSSLLRQVIFRLERVIFSQRHIVQRMIHPITFLYPGGGFKMNRSVPITPSITRFNRLPTDPRPIEEELKKMHVGYHLPHRAVRAWFRLLRRLRLQENQLKIDYRFLLSHESHSSLRICNRGDANNWVQEEDKKWKEILKEKRKRYKERAREETPAELAKAPRPAMGFWMFPLESIGALPGIDKCRLLEPRGRSRGFLDMSKYSPQLCLSQLP